VHDATAAVGFRVLQLPDSTRPYVVGRDSVARPLLAMVWYPAVGRGMTLAQRDYLVEPAGGDPLVALRARFSEQGLAVPDSLLDRWLDGTTPAIRDAEPRAGPFPVLLLETGLNAPGLAFASLGEALAAREIVVVALASFGHGRDMALGFDLAGIETQVADLRHVLGALEDVGFVARDRIVAGGWSVGALAAMLLADRSPGRVRGVISLDGAPGYAYGVELAHGAGLRAACLSVPFLHLTGTAPGRFRVPKSRELFEELPGESAFWGAVPHLTHGDFVDLHGVRSPHFATRSDTMGVRSGTSQLHDLVTAFVRRRTGGDAAAWEAIIARGELERLGAEPNAPASCGERGTPESR